MSVIRAPYSEPCRDSQHVLRREAECQGIQASDSSIWSSMHIDMEYGWASTRGISQVQYLSVDVKRGSLQRYLEVLFKRISTLCSNAHFGNTAAILPLAS